jgi:hypothetical protein
MPSLDGAEHPLISELQEAFGALVHDESVDIVPVEDDAEQDACEVQADDWTLFVEGWPLTAAWIAIDDDVSGPEEFRTALESTLGERDIKAMQSLDKALSGAFAATLTESGDGLSMALAAMITANVEG